MSLIPPSPSLIPWTASSKHRRPSYRASHSLPTCHFALMDFDLSFKQTSRFPLIGRTSVGIISGMSGWSRRCLNFSIAPTFSSSVSRNYWPHWISMATVTIIWHRFRQSNSFFDTFLLVTSSTRISIRSLIRVFSYWRVSWNYRSHAQRTQTMARSTGFFLRNVSLSRIHWFARFSLKICYSLI